MNPLASLLRGLIRLYQLAISPLLGPNCRYYPTCSAYALEAVEQHGMCRGGWMAVRRVARRLLEGDLTLAALGPIDGLESLDKIASRLAA